ncbi:MAG: TolC family protein, partial [Rubrimonas sp.]
RAGLLPQLGASASAAAARQSLEDPAIRPFASFPGFARDIERFDVSLAASWEIDLFGAAPRSRAARASARAAAADLAAMRVAVAAETATAWIDILELQARQALAEERLDTLRRQRDALRLRAGAGTLARLDLDRFEAETEAAAAAPLILSALATAQAERLGVLIADAAFARELAAQRHAFGGRGTMETLDTAAISLADRPDVVAAGHRLAAADAGLAASRAQRLPRVQLGGVLATIAASPAALFSAPALARQAGAALSLPLFDFGRIDAAIADAKGAQRGALAAYRQTLLQAAAEVEANAALLAARRAEDERQASAAAAAERARTAAAITHDAGASDLTTLLDVERASIAAREGRVMAEAASARALVALFRATASTAAKEHAALR